MAHFLYRWYLVPKLSWYKKNGIIQHQKRNDHFVDSAGNVTKNKDQGVFTIGPRIGPNLKVSEAKERIRQQITGDIDMGDFTIVGRDEHRSDGQPNDEYWAQRSAGKAK